MTYTTYPYAVKANGVYYSANMPVPVPDAAVEPAAPEKAVAAEPAKEETKPDAAVEPAAPAAEKAATKSANKRKGRKAKSAD